MANRETIINRKWCSSFIAGGMNLELKGTCTADDLEDAEKIMELALGQIRRERTALSGPTPDPETGEK